MENISRVSLREILSNHFSLDELQVLCFDLGIDSENLRGETKQARAVEIVTYCERHGRTNDLIAAVRRLRPNLDVMQEKPVADETIGPPAVARPLNLSFDAHTIGDWPSGWFNSRGFVDDVSTDYAARVVPRDDGKGSCVFFQNPYAAPTEFGSLMQRCPAHHLAGKAIRLEAEIKTWQVEQWAGLWLRADGDRIPNLVFDNMSRRPIRGTTPWTTYGVDVQLPQETTWLNYGIVLAGRGVVWADNFRLMVWTSNGKWMDV